MHNNNKNEEPGLHMNEIDDLLDLLGKGHRRRKKIEGSSKNKIEEVIKKKGRDKGDSL